MKKLLGLLAVAPMAITACGGGSTEPGLYGVNVGSSTAMMDQIVSGDIDFAGTWGDARRFNGTGDNSSIVAIGVEEHRIANDGIQAASDMTEQDIYWVQQLFEKVLNEEATEEGLGVDLGSTDDDGAVVLEHVLEVYGHETYKKTVTTTEEVSYLKDGVPTMKDMTSKTPATTALAGTKFDATGKLNTNQSLNITFIPSTNPVHATTASARLQTWMRKELGSDDVTINVATDYDGAATALEENTIDLAFLPVNTWAQSAPSSNFILQAGRSAQVATLDIDTNGDAYQPSTITNQKLTTSAMNRFSQLYVADVTDIALAENDLDEWQTEFKASMSNKADEFYGWANAVNAYADGLAADSPELIAGSYEALIWAKKGSEIETLVTNNYNTADYKNDWTIDVSDIALNYGFTSTTSSSTFLFPELWLKNHLDSTLTLN